MLPIQYSLTYSIMIFVMKQFFLFLFFIAYQLNCNAQIPSNLEDLKNYYTNNIQNLKPMEGIYSWRQKWTDTILNTVHTSTGSKAFFYSKSHGFYVCLHIDDNGKITYRLDRGVNYIYDESTHLLCYDDGRCLNRINNFDFFVTHEKWDSGDSFERTYSRIFPTKEMFEIADVDNRVQGAFNLISNGFFSSALAILDDVLKTWENDKVYYYRAAAYHGLKEFGLAIQDCNKALNFKISSENAEKVYFLRGLCYLSLNNKEQGLIDIKRAGELGAKFLEANGFTNNHSTPTNNDKPNNRGVTKKMTNGQGKTIPSLKKTK